MKTKKSNWYFEKMNRCIKPNEVAELGSEMLSNILPKSEIMRPMFIVTYYHSLTPI